MGKTRQRGVLISLLLVSLGSAHAANEWKLTLGATEREWAAAHPVVRVAMAKQSGPFSFVDAKGALAGMSVDTVAAVAEHTGLRFEQHAYDDVTEALAAIERGEADAVLLVGKTDDRAARFLFSEAVSLSPDAIVTRTDAPFLFDTSMLGERRVAMAASSLSARASLQHSAPTAEIVIYPTMAQAVQAVSRGEVFAAVTDASIAAFTAKQEHLTNVRVSGIFSAPTGMHVAVRRDWPELVTIFDAALHAMPASERAALTNRWVVLDYESDRRWQQAFSIAAGVLVIVALTLLLALLDSRRRARELVVRRKMQADLEAAHAALEGANRDKGVLMRMLAHDLRNPLTTLTLNIDGLELMPDLSHPERQVVAKEMRADVKRMVELIESLLELQSIEDGKRTFRKDPLALGDLVRESVTAMNEWATRKRLTVRLETAPLAPVESDPSAVRQVVENLLSNALKYSPAGAEIVVKVGGDAAHQRVSVRDAGPGISSDDQGRLFQKYGRGSAKPTGGESSTGLGLWICQQLANGLGATLRCESTVGAGAQFTLELPTRVLP